MTAWKMLRTGRTTAIAIATVCALSLAAMALPGCSQLADFALGYDDSSGTGGSSASTGVLSDSLSARPSYGAVQAAIYYSHRLAPPDDLYEMFASDGRKIAAMNGRIDPGDTDLPAFSPPWIPGEVYMRVDTVVHTAMQAGDYHAWDEINRIVGAKEFQYSPHAFDGERSVRIRFDHRFHPRHVGRMYSELPGVTRCGADYPIGDNGETLILISPDRRLYFYRSGWGDCECGCIHNTWSVIEVDQSGARVLEHLQDLPLGQWEDEIEAAREEYYRCAHALE